MAQGANTLQIQLNARNSFFKCSPETLHLIHAAYAVQDLALIQQTKFVANKHAEMPGY